MRGIVNAGYAYHAYRNRHNPYITFGDGAVKYPLRALVTKKIDISNPAERSQSVKRSSKKSKAGPSGTKRKRGLRGKGSGLKKMKKCSLKNLCKQVKRIDSRLREGETTLEFRFKGTGQYVKPVNRKLHVANIGMVKATFDNVLAQLQYYNATSGEFETKAFEVSTADQKTVLIDSCSTTLSLKNSYQVPVAMDIYLVQPKENSSLSPVADFQTGMGNKLVDPTIPTDHTLINLKDSQEFRYRWSSKKIRSVTLIPGQTTSVSRTVRGIIYDPTAVSALAAQRQLKSFYFYIVFKDNIHNLGHSNPTVTVFGHLNGAVDYSVTQITKVKYDGGMNGHRIVINSPQITDVITGGVTGMSNITDNQALNAA